jgi:hypothetical protein
MILRNVVILQQTEVLKCPLLLSDFSKTLRSSTTCNKRARLNLKIHGIPSRGSRVPKRGYAEGRTYGRTDIAMVSTFWQLCQSAIPDLELHVQGKDDTKININSQIARRVKVVGSNPTQGMDACVYSVFELGSGLATG